MRRNLLFAALVWACTLTSCDEIPDPPNPARLVNDFAGIFTSGQADSLERVLVDYEHRTTHQICVVTVKTLGSLAVDDYGLALGNKWGIGTEKDQNGVLLLIKPRGRDNNYIDVTIQVGRGLEGSIPDAYASRIIRNIMGPYLKRDSYWPATVKACDELMGLASGEIDQPHSEKSLKQSLRNIRYKIKAGIKNVLIIIALGLAGWLVIWIINLFHKDDDDDKKKPKSRKKDSGDDVSPPTIGPMPIDIGDFKGHSGDSGGFGGFGGGGFGGGGASGRF